MNPKEFKRFESIFDLIPIPIQIWEKREDKFQLVNFNEATTDWGVKNLNSITPQELLKNNRPRI